MGEIPGRPAESDSSPADFLKRIEQMLEVCERHCRHVSSDTRALAAGAMRAVIGHLGISGHSHGVGAEGAHLEQVDRLHQAVAVLALRLIEREELLSAIRKGIVGHLHGDSTSHCASLAQILDEIDSALCPAAAWRAFESELELVHGPMLDGLGRRFPVLSRTELKVAALLRMGMSSKEIAHVLSTTPKNIEMHRYRIRKKLGLETTESVIEHLRNV